MLDQVAGYDVVHIFDLPREFRFIELAFVSFFFLYAYIRSSGMKNRFEFLYAPYFLVAIGVLGGVLNGVGIVDTFQGLYLYLSPLLIFYTALWLGFSFEEFRTLKAVIIWILILNIPAWFYQFIFYFISDGNGDNVNGILRDAHVFALLFYSTTIYTYTDFLLRKNILSGLISFILFVIGFMAFNEKATLFLIPILVIIFIWTANKSLKQILITFVITFLLAYSTYLLSHSVMMKVGNEFRTNELTDVDISDIGTIIAYIQLPFVFSDVPYALLYGVGSGNYGSAIALRKNVEGTSTELSKKYVGDLELAGAIGAFAWRTNYFIGALVECGIIFTLILLSFYFRIIKYLVKYYNVADNNKIKSISACTFGTITLLWLVGFVSNISNLDEGILIYPTMLAGALIINETKNKRKGYL